jgi:hypothetical protein
VLGQVVIEYFILFAVIGAVTLVGATLFDGSVRDTMQQFYRDAVSAMNAIPK